VVERTEGCLARVEKGFYDSGGGWGVRSIWVQESGKAVLDLLTLPATLVAMLVSAHREKERGRERDERDERTRERGTSPLPVLA
jgi:hypothetical protein